MTDVGQQETTPTFRVEMSSFAVPISRKVSIASLLWLTAAIAIFIQLLSLWVSPVVHFLVPIAVFFFVLRPRLGRFDLPTYEICGIPGLWATGVNAITTPIAVLISTFAPPLASDEFSPYRDHPIEFPFWMILLVFVIYGFVGVFVGSMCSLVLSALTAIIRNIAKQGGTSREV
jgi:hypothetical protein